MMSNVKVVRYVVVVLVCLVCVAMGGVWRGASAQTPFSCADVTEIPTIECDDSA